jgi:PBSX family phage terminase large subunit
MTMQELFSEKQLEFITKSHAHWNLAHGAVRSGKTVGTLFRFMLAVEDCPDSDIWMVGHSSETIFQNAVRLLLESPQLELFRPFCSWESGKRRLRFRDKTIGTLGAKDEGAIGSFQGKTFSLTYCDEMTLYPESIIDMIDTRLSRPYSMGFASMNPSYPSHKIKKWIDMAEEGNPNYYSLHFTLEDNPYVDDAYKDRIRNSLSGLFFKRNYLGLWCLAEGAIFDFFDRAIHVLNKPPAAAEYWIAGIDYGVSNAFAVVLIGINTGMSTQTGKRLWVEKEYYWDCKKTQRQKTNSEFANDVQEFLEPYAVRGIYIDPSAASMKVELSRRGMHIIDADNDVLNGISVMTSEMAKGNLYVLKDCPNLIREIEGYVWDEKKSKQGEDEPVKKADHAVDALRYCIHTHKVTTYDPYKDKERANNWMQNKYQVTRKF